MGQPTGRRGNEEFRTEHDFSDGTSLSTDVVLAVSAVTGIDPRDMPSLDRVVTPDALNMLFPNPSRQSASECELVFTYAGCEVTVRNDGEITVRPLPK